jgi:hypothetical protein
MSALGSASVNFILSFSDWFQNELRSSAAPYWELLKLGFWLDVAEGAPLALHSCA